MSLPATSRTPSFGYGQKAGSYTPVVLLFYFSEASESQTHWPWIYFAVSDVVE